VSIMTSETNELRTSSSARADVIGSLKLNSSFESERSHGVRFSWVQFKTVFGHSSSKKGVRRAKALWTQNRTTQSIPTQRGKIRGASPACVGRHSSLSTVSCKSAGVAFEDGARPTTRGKGASPGTEKSRRAKESKEIRGRRAMGIANPPEALTDSDASPKQCPRPTNLGQITARGPLGCRVTQARSFLRA
jgi:hypothetical protein